MTRDLAQVKPQSNAVNVWHSACMCPLVQILMLRQTKSKVSWKVLLFYYVKVRDVLRVREHSGLHSDLKSIFSTIFPETITLHCTWQVVLPEKFCAKQMVLKNVIRTYWGMQKSKMQNHIMCPLRGLVQHRPKNPPNLGRMGCLCQLLSPKGHMIWFLFFQYTFPVAKWVRKYPPCALHKTFLVK